MFGIRLAPPLLLAGSDCLLESIQFLSIHGYYLLPPFFRFQACRTPRAVAILATYTHLQPCRRHILLLHPDSMRIRLLSTDDNDVADSDWHGIHTWQPRCEIFHLDGFHYAGLDSRLKHRYCYLDSHAACWGLWKIHWH